VSDSRWSDREVRRVATKHAIGALTKREPIEAWILDAIGFFKTRGARGQEIGVLSRLPSQWHSRYEEHARKDRLFFGR
jgi:uncharacterized protein YqjF (DUF2071 family)